MLPTVCFVTAHPNPSNHFVEYIQIFEEKGIGCTVIADKNVSEKFSGLKARVIELDFQSLKSNELISKIQDVISSQSIVITDIASERWVLLHTWLKKCHPEIKRAVYYDNPEPFVPGGYSTMAAKVIEQVQLILFANASLPEKGIQGEGGIPLEISDKHAIGIGYYPKNEAEQILTLRKDPDEVCRIRTKFFSQHKLVDNGQKIFTYIGGANEEYYSIAFPRFVDILSELVCSTDTAPLKNTIVIVQLHPRTNGDDIDCLKKFLQRHTLPLKSHIVISRKDDMDSKEAVAISNGVFYHQTSMAAQFALAKVPIIVQIARKLNPDILLNSGYPFVKKASELAKIIVGEEQKVDSAKIQKGLGIDDQWKTNLLKLFDL